MARTRRAVGLMPGRNGLVDAQLVVIGGGAAGLAAARAGKRRGANVVLISDGPLGGDCTFTGCVPSKTLLAGARKQLTFPDAMANVRRTVASIAAGENEQVLSDEGIVVVRARAQFADATTLIVEGRRISPHRFVVATGATPFVPPLEGLELTQVLTSDTLFELETLPTTLTILGGGPIGVEMAEAFARLGSRVTVVEGGPRLLPREEPEAAQVMTSLLEELGVTIIVAKSGTSVQRTPSGAHLVLDDGTSISAPILLVAIGRTPSSSGFGLEAAGVEVDRRGFITVDRTLRTSSPRIYAAGDVSQTLQFTHVADETGRIAVTNALSKVVRRQFHPEWIPMVTYTSLEVARVGKVESEVHHPRARVAYFPMADLDRALTSGETRGFVKLIVEPRRLTGSLGGGTLVGATIVAPRAGEMLQEVVLAMRAGLWPARLATTTHAYPTWSIAVQQAAAQFFGEFGGRRARGANDGDQPTE